MIARQWPSFDESLHSSPTRIHPSSGERLFQASETPNDGRPGAATF
jgi:hypothetical protein